jgi:tetratricopeptide (TPR) repeat protein
MKKIYSIISSWLILIFIILVSKTSFSQSNNPPGTNYALVIGISSYPNLSQQLLYADDDAELFYDFLRTEGVCYKKNIYKLIDSFANRAAIYGKLETLLRNVKEKDKVFIYFAGHGDVETELDAGYLLPYDCYRNNYAVTAIDLIKLDQYVTAIIKKKAEVVIIIDACKSGSLAGELSGASSTMTAITNRFNNSIKLLSCQPNQLSQEKKYIDGGHGIFTYHLVDGLKGLADKNNDKLITGRELQYYLTKVDDETNQKQMPEVEGNLEKVILTYDESIKKTLISLKRADIEKKSFVSRSIIDEELDSNYFYKSFAEHIRNGRLIDSIESNAYNTIQEAIKNKQDSNLIENMKIELVSAMEDEVQKWITKYLNGEERTIKQFYKPKILKRNKELMDSCLSLSKDSEIRFLSIKAKLFFFDAISEFVEYGNEKLKNCLSKLNYADSLMPNQAWINNNIANIYSQMHFDSLADNYYKRAIEISPKWRNAWNNRGTYYLESNSKWVSSIGVDQIKNLNLADSFFNQALTIDSLNTFYALSGKGEIYLYKGDYFNAEKYLKLALQDDSTDIHTLELLGFLYSMEKKYKDLELAFRKVLTFDSLHNLARVHIGNALLSQKDTSSAINEFIAQISYFPDDAYVWGKLFQLNKNLNDTCYNKAIYILNSKISLDSMDGTSWVNLGIMESFKTRDFKKVEPLFMKSIEVEPNNKINNINVACFYSLNNDIKKGLLYLENALKLGYNDFNSIDLDPDLSNLRKDKGFKLLMKKYRK